MSTYEIGGHHPHAPIPGKQGGTLGRSQNNGENALFLARSTWNERRELLFQVHNPEIAHIALQSLLTSRQWERDWDYRMEQDLEWSKPAYIFQLFPQAKGSDA